MDPLVDKKCWQKHESLGINIYIYFGL
jgi:hypothetical protein